MKHQPLVPDDPWETIDPFLPNEPLKPQVAPGFTDRAALAGIIFVLKTGIAWQLLPSVDRNGIPFAVRLLAAIARDSTLLPPLVNAIPAIIGPPPVDQRPQGLGPRGLDSEQESPVVGVSALVSIAEEQAERRVLPERKPSRVRPTA